MPYNYVVFGCVLHQFFAVTLHTSSTIPTHQQDQHQAVKFLRIDPLDKPFAEPHAERQQGQRPRHADDLIGVEDIRGDEDRQFEQIYDQEKDHIRADKDRGRHLAEQQIGGDRRRACIRQCRS